jgi:MGT family glycosyltransferase
LSKEEEEALPGRPLVVSYAPQYELLARASLTITHAGLNTVLDSLANGVPLVTVPITYEQPAIARRVELAGAGECISMRRLEPGRLRKAVREVLEWPRYRESARRLADATRAAGGVLGAAEIVEAALA